MLYDGTEGVVQAYNRNTTSGIPLWLNYGIGNTILGGNVGIGTTGPTQTLDVRGNVAAAGTTNSSSSQVFAYSNINATSTNPQAQMFAYGSTNSTNYEGLKAGTAGLYTAYGDMVLNVDTSNAFRLFMGATEAVHVTSGGSVGIGTTSPAYTLTVWGHAAISDYLYNVGNTSYLSRRIECRACSQW